LFKVNTRVALLLRCKCMGDFLSKLLNNVEFLVEAKFLTLFEEFLR
jgi:hypothetical protein